MTTVVFIDEIPPNVKEYLEKKLETIENLKLLFLGNDKKRLMKEIPYAEIVVGWRPTLILLKKALNLRLFINPGAGVRHLIEMFQEINQERTVLLANGHGNSYFVAQHAVGLLLTLMNKIIPHHLWMREGKWRTGDKDAVSIPLRFRKVGLLGYGAINQKVHRMLSGFDVEFSILRKHWDKQKEALITSAKRFEISQLHDFLREIDILIIALPSTSLTDGLISQEEIKLLGKDGIIVNVARGEILDEESLYNALKEKKIVGAAIDVWYNRTPKKNEEGRRYPFNFSFHLLDNIILSPHRGYSPFSDLLRWNEVVENISRISQGRKELINIVNLEDEY